MQKGFLTLFLTLFLACSSAQAGVADRATQDEVLIGATLPLTGAEAKTGVAFKEGYDLAIESANRAGGVLVSGRRIAVRLELLDDHSSPADAVSLAEKLIDERKVKFLLGTYSSSLVTAQSAVPELAHVPYVNGGGAAAEIYTRAPKYVFGLLAPVDLLAYSEMRWLDVQQNEGRLPAKMRVAVLWENTAHGKDFRRGVIDFATKTARRRSSYEVVFDDSFTLDAPDAKSLMAKLKAANADVFLADAHLPDFIALHKQYVAQKLCHSVVSYGARGSERQAAEALGRENVDYILSAVWWNSQLGASGLNKEFVQAFQAKHHRLPEWYHALGYETARVLLAAIEQAGSLDREKVREELAKLDIETILPGGRTRFNGHQAQYPFVVQQNQPDGSSPIVYPLELAQTKGTAVNPKCVSKALSAR